MTTGRRGRWDFEFQPLDTRLSLIRLKAQQTSALASDKDLGHSRAVAATRTENCDSIPVGGGNPRGSRARSVPRVNPERAGNDADRERLGKPIVVRDCKFGRTWRKTIRQQCFNLAGS